MNMFVKFCLKRIRRLLVFVILTFMDRVKVIKVVWRASFFILIFSLITVNYRSCLKVARILNAISFMWATWLM